jgi:hypothetical protein
MRHNKDTTHAVPFTYTDATTGVRVTATMLRYREAPSYTPRVRVRRVQSLASLLAGVNGQLERENRNARKLASVPFHFRPIVPTVVETPREPYRPPPLKCDGDHTRVGRPGSDPDAD